MAIRNKRYPNLGDNTNGRCFTCGSDCPNGQCPRQCNEYGPVLTLTLQPMDPAWVGMSNELGSTAWFSSDENMRSEIEYWTKYFQAQPERVVALNHMRETMRRYGVSV